MNANRIMSGKRQTRAKAGDAKLLKSNSLTGYDRSAAKGYFFAQSYFFVGNEITFKNGG
jgi:hypothetical protein